MSFEGVGTREIQGTFKCSDDTPGNTVPGIVETGEWTLCQVNFHKIRYFESFDVWQEICFWDLDVVH